MRYLRTNTATRITVGPFFDKTDGVTPETSITVTSCKLTLTVDTAGVPTLVLDTAPTASGGSNDMVHITGDDAGFYDLELAAADVNYLGRAMLAITDAAVHCPVFHEFMILPAMVYDAFVVGSDRFDVNVTHITDQSQTARDIGASVLLSSGTGTGQLDFTSGVVKSNLVQILATALTETAGQIAAAFKQFFDVASPTGTMKAITNVVTATNLTNAPTNGDLTATMKASVEVAADSAITGNTSLALEFTALSSALKGLTLVTNTIGATGNDTTHIHLAGLTYGDDELIGHLLVIYDASENEYHSRWILDYVGATDLATVATLPFTPQNSTDIFRLTSIRRDVNVKQVNDVDLIGDGDGTPWGPA